MKRVLAMLAMTCAFSVAQAESWILVQESDSGSRLLVDVDSYKRDIKGDDGTTFAGALFRFFIKGEAGAPFAFLVETESCKSMNGQLISRKWENGKWVTTEKYWWSKDGNKMYDSGGTLLCGAYNQSKTTTETNPKSGTSGKNMI
jgi:hypothetical protein